MAKSAAAPGSASKGATRVNGKVTATKQAHIQDKVPVALDGEEVSDEEESSDEEYDEGKDVSSRGLARLMAALGENGLSEEDQARLQAIQAGTGDEDDKDEDSEDGEDEDDADDDELDQEEVAHESEEDITPAAPVKKAAGGSLAESLARAGLIPQEESDDEEEEDEDEDEDDDDDGGVPLESLTDAQLAELPETVRSNRMYREKINDEAALTRIRDDIALGGPSKGKGKETLPWIETLVVTYDKSIEGQLEAQGEGSAENDLKRELEFYKQALYTATEGRKLAKDSNLPFTRPNDYYAEMVKSDEHMERVRQRLLDERAGIKAAEEAKKQRELKKFGKKVQVEKQLERQKSKKDMEERVKGLKRKRQGGLDGADGDDDDDGFNIRLETAISGGEDKGKAKGKDARGGKPKAKMPRDSRNAKFGFGGKKKYSKENTRESTNDFGSGPRRSGPPKAGAKGKRAPAKRPGKSKRTARR